MIPENLSVNALTSRTGSIFKTVSDKFTEKSKTTSLYNSAMREDGLLPGTLVASANGWTAVEAVQPGDKVMTFDYGMQPVIENRTLEIDLKHIPERKAFVMHIPRGALGNRVDMTLMPMQEVIIESDKAEQLYGDPFVLMPSLLLDGFEGISKHPVSGTITLHMLLFEGQQVVQTSGGALTLAHTHGCFSPLSKTAPTPREVYVRLSPQKLMELIDWKVAPEPSRGHVPVPQNEAPSQAPGSDHLHPAFAGQSIEDSYAALASRMR